MSDDVSYGLVEPFDCDDLMFCLGVEWEQFRQQLINTADEHYSVMIHRENAERLAAMCDRHGRFSEVLPCPISEEFPYDHFEEWRVIKVGGWK